MSLEPTQPDIFISYRQNDNQADRTSGREGWVSQFVSRLEQELVSLMKEPVRIYFDTNPHSGILENHLVNETLEAKLNCPIFIPILSQTYCDQKSFAWREEFLPFLRITETDGIGRSIKLPNGNIASRVLPIKIHELDSSDQQSFELALGGHLRAIDFIYKEPGVNRPLNPSDHRKDNTLHTDYQNQINKVAHAIKDLMGAMQHQAAQSPGTSPAPTSQPVKRSSKSKIALSLTLVATLILMYAVYAQWPFSTNSGDQELSIAVLPFDNLSTNPEQESFCDGLTGEIITQLSNVPNLLVISRGSSMTYKESTKKVSEVAKELGVRFILDGSIQRSENSLLVTAQLIDAERDVNLWAEKMSGTLDDVFDMQDKISKAIVDKLRIRLTQSEEIKFYQRQFDNAQAYEFYLRAKPDLLLWTPESIERARQNLQKGLDIMGPHPVLIGGLAYCYWSFANLGVDANQNFALAEQYANQAFELDPNSAEGYLVRGLLYQTRDADQKKALENLQMTLSLRPFDTHAMTWMLVGYCVTGKTKPARLYAEKLQKIDPLTPYAQFAPNIVDFYEGKFDAAVNPARETIIKEKDNPFWRFFGMVIMENAGHHDEAVALTPKGKPKFDDAISPLSKALGYIITAQRDSANLILSNEIIQKAARIDCQYAQFMSSLYARNGMEKESLDWMESAVQRGFWNYEFLRHGDLAYRNMKSPRYLQLIEKARENSLTIPD